MPRCTTFAGILAHISTFLTTQHYIIEKPHECASFEFLDSTPAPAAGWDSLLQPAATTSPHKHNSQNILALILE
jgi:hypothetical protein